MKRQLEYRTRATSIVLEDTATTEGTQTRKLVGYASKFGVPSEDMGGYTEVIARGAFTKSLANNDIKAFFNHDFNLLLARKKNGTLRLFEDEQGLGFEMDIGDTTLGNDVYAMVKRGDIDGVSFGFYALADSWSEDGLVNTILEADLIEISPVVFPAYSQPTIEARSLERIAKRPDPKKRQFRVDALLRIARQDF